MNFDEQQFQEYIQAREAKKQHMNILNAKFNDVRMTFGKYKGEKVYDLANMQYLTWISNNVDVENELLNEAIEFYKDYYFPQGDGHD